MESVVKIFADDTSFFSVVTDPVTSARTLNNDLRKVTEWAHQWKMSFNPDPNKQAVEVCFSRKTTKTNSPPLVFNNVPVSSQNAHKHLGIILDKKLTFDHHLKEKILKANKGIALITRVRKFVPRDSLIRIYKAFIRPHLDYGDIIYDNPTNELFCQKIESVQYRAALAITGCFRGTSRDRLYNELGLESLRDGRWCRRLVFFYKVINGLAPTYLNNYLPQDIDVSYNLRRPQVLHNLVSRTDRFQDSFFPYCVSKWKQLDPDITKLPYLSSFKKALFNFVRLAPATVYNIHEPFGIMLLTRLRVCFSHLREHKFHHNFMDTIDPFCNCQTNSIETTEHYLLRCPTFTLCRLNLFDVLHKNDISLLPYNAAHLTSVLLYGDKLFCIESNRIILRSVINYILKSKRFDESLIS